MGAIRNFVLDMGNVLFDYNPGAMTEYFLPAAPEEDKERFLKEFFSGSEWIDRDLGIISEEEMYHSISKRLPPRLHESLRNCLQSWPLCMKPFEEAQNFVRFAKERGYGLYVLSNASQNFYGYFPRFGPLYWFDGIVISSDIHLLKPDPAIYRYLFEKYGLSPAECLFIDDREENVEAARALGMQGVVFDGNWEDIRQRFCI
ncbi:MAG: HAD family hydrolase [Hydrogeniiclostridium sp.]